MDEVTQQNSALVEESAAAAKTLEQQALAMDERVAFFDFGGNAEIQNGAVSRAAHDSSPRARTGRGMAPKLKSA
jgi:hypothetical protein